MASTSGDGGLKRDHDTSSQEDLGHAGALLPEGIEAPASALGDELLSRASLAGPAATGFVLDVLKRDAREEVQYKGVQALAQIAETPPGRKVLLETEAVECVVEAMMSATPEEVLLQYHGCSALANIVIGGEGEGAVLDKGGLAAVFAAAKAHPADAGVQTKSCLALGNIAFGATGEAKVLSDGGLDIVVAAMKAFPAEVALQTEGVDALVNIADSPGGKQTLLGLGGLAVVAAAKKHDACKETAGALATALVAAAKETQ